LPLTELAGRWEQLVLDSIAIGRLAFILWVATTAIVDPAGNGIPNAGFSLGDRNMVALLHPVTLMLLERFHPQPPSILVQRPFTTITA